MKLGTKCYVDGKEAQYTGEVAGLFTYRVEDKEVALSPEEADSRVKTSVSSKKADSGDK